MATGRRGTTEGPLALVASLGAGRGRRRRRTGAVLTEQVRGLRDGAAGLLAGPLPKGLAKRLPGRKRKSFMKRAGQRLDGLSKVASGAATALTVAAAAAEVVSSIRSQGDEDGRQRSGPASRAGRQPSGRPSGTGRATKSGATSSRSKSTTSSKPRQSKQEAMRHAS